MVKSPDSTAANSSAVSGWIGLKAATWRSAAVTGWHKRVEFGGGLAGQRARRASAVRRRPLAAWATSA